MAYVFSGIFATMTGAVLGRFSDGNAFAMTYPPKAYIVLLAINAVLLLIPAVVARFIPDYKGKNIYQPSCQFFSIGKR